MSVWNKAYEDFRRPYYEEEKKSKKDYDGDGKVESGSKEHAGAVHNAIQRAKGGKADGKDTRKEEIEVEEGYKEIDKKKENKMYRRAGNLARTALSSKGKKKETAMNKSSKIVSAISRQKENERFSKMADEKARSNYKEESEIEEGMKQARKNVGASTCWDGYKAKGTKKKDGKEVPNCVKEDEVAEGYGKKKGLYANIHAKRARGESPAKPGDEDYPAKGAFKKAAKTAKKEHYDWRSDFDFVIEKKSEDCGGCDDTPKKGGVKNKITVMPEVKTEETELQEGPYMVTKPDITGNTPAYRNFRAGMKSKVTGKPMYQLAPGVKLPEDVELDEDDKSYDRNRKRAAQRAADRNAARAAGKTGAVPGVGYVTPRRERETYVDSSGTTRHKSGAKMPKKEEVEFAGNYEGPLYAPHPDLAKENLQSTVDSLTKKAQGALQSIGVKINKTPKSTARPSAQTANTMRQNKMSNESLLDKVVKTYVPEEDYDRMKDRRMERGGVGGNTDYKKTPKNNTNKFGKGKTVMQKELEKKHGKGASAMDIVRAEIQKKYGKGAIMDKKKKDK